MRDVRRPRREAVHRGRAMCYEQPPMADGAFPPKLSPTPEAIAACAELLEALADDRALLACADAETRRRLTTAAGRVSRPERSEQRDLRKALQRRDRKEQRQADDAARRTTAIRAIRELPVYPTPPRLAEIARATSGAPLPAVTAAAEPPPADSHSANPRQTATLPPRGPPRGRRGEGPSRSRASATSARRSTAPSTSSTTSSAPRAGTSTTRRGSRRRRSRAGWRS